MSSQLIGKFLLSGQIECITGLHIGGTTTGVEIGGVDNPVIKDPLTDQPYIPGSALKGKLRSLTEWSLGLIARHKKHDSYAAYDCAELEEPCPEASSPNYERWQRVWTLGKLYGAASDNTKVRITSGPTRLTIRDSFLTPESQKLLQDTLGRGTFTEVKTENALDRVTSEANPRPIERVPAGSQFDFNFILDVYEPGDRELLRDLLAAMHLLEQSSLGGSGSRGHGQICFQNLKLVWRSLEYYRSGSSEQPIELSGTTLKSVLQGFDGIKWPV